MIWPISGRSSRFNSAAPILNSGQSERKEITNVTHRDLSIHCGTKKDGEDHVRAWHRQVRQYRQPTVCQLNDRQRAHGLDAEEHPQSHWDLNERYQGRRPQANPRLAVRLAHLQSVTLQRDFIPAGADDFQLLLEHLDLWLKRQKASRVLQALDGQGNQNDFPENTPCDDGPEPGETGGDVDEFKAPAD